jgi:transcriptional regulator with XRE-family HTH domain
MRGAGDQLSIGERIAFYRNRRQLTQAALAHLVGRSEDWLSKIERGERPLRRLDVLTLVARELRVSLGDLLGEPILIEDPFRDDDVPAVRDALMAPSRLSRILFAEAPPRATPPLANVAERVEFGWDDYQRGRLGRVISQLPELIRSTQWLEDLADDPVRAAATSARVHHLAATTLSKVGESDLAWIAAERAMQAADKADDPLVLASAARAGTHALLAVGRYSDALQLGEAARTWLRSRLVVADPAALSLLGMLHLRMAVAAARQQDRSTATELLDHATREAAALGRDANYWKTSFGPTNVALHRLSTALDLGDVGYVVEKGQGVDTRHLPVERAVSYQIDVARAMSYAAHDDDVLAALLAAEAEAPQLVRHSPAVREVVRSIHRRSPITAGARSSEAMALAQRCRAV